MLMLPAPQGAEDETSARRCGASLDVGSFARRRQARVDASAGDFRRHDRRGAFGEQLLHVDLHAALQVARRERIVDDRLERRHRRVELARLVLGKAEHFARRVAHRRFRHDRAADALLNRGDVALVDQQIGAHHQREFAQMRVRLRRRRARHRRQPLRRSCPAGPAATPRGTAPACRICARALRDHFVERLLGRGEIGAVGNRGRRVELVRRPAGVALGPPVPALIAGDEQNHGYGGADDERRALPPQLAHAVAAQFLVDFTKKCIVGHEDP